jgi:hypothetical protein
MNIRTTTDPEVHNPDDHPCVYEGDGDNGISIYFENEDNRKTYMELETGGNIVLQSNDSDDYVAEG